MSEQDMNQITIPEEITQDPNAKKPKSTLRVVIEWVETVVVSLVIAILLFTFVIRIVTIVGSSMAETLQDGDIVISSNLFYTPERGDIVVVDSYNGYGEALTKRIIGVAGDEINIDFNNSVVYVNGEILSEPYLTTPTTRQFDVTFPVTVPEGCVFILGDNRPVSLDSRDTRIGFVDERDILGHVLLRIYPFSSFGTVK